MRNYELQANNDARASFYGKARVEFVNGEEHLISYTTHVATIKSITDSDGKAQAKAEVYGTYSQTTLRHIKEFLLQSGFKAENSKQIMADYGVTR